SPTVTNPTIDAVPSMCPRPSRCTLFPYTTLFRSTAFDNFLDAAIGSLVDYGANSDSRLLWIANAQTGGGGEQPLHHTFVIFLEDDQTRTGGAFLSLVTESGINCVHDRFVKIGVGIDNDRVLAAHLADHALELSLAGAGF